MLLTPITKLNIAKRKRADGTDASTAMQDVNMTATASTAATPLQTPRLRTLQTTTPIGGVSSHLTALMPLTNAAPSTPLLTMPTPSSELLPVLNARQARATADTPSSHSTHLALLGRSNTSGNAMISSPPTAAASSSSSALLASQYSTQLRAIENASIERERALRLQVDELRATLRSKENDLTEAQLKAEQRETQVQHRYNEYERKIDKLGGQMKFIFGEEHKASSSVQSLELELEQANKIQRDQRLEIAKLKQQLANSPSAIRKSIKSDADMRDDEDEASHLEMTIENQQRTITELESQLDTLSTRLDEASQAQVKLSDLQAQLDHAQSLLRESESSHRLNAAQVEAAQIASKRSADYLATESRCELLQAENSRLNQQRFNVVLKEEQLKDAQAKLARLEEEREAAAKTHVENAQLRSKLKEWEESMSRLGLVDNDASADDMRSNEPSSKRARHTLSRMTPQPFLDSYHQLQAENLSLHSRVNQAEQRAMRTSEEAHGLSARLTVVTSQLTTLQETVTKNQAELLHSQRRINLLTKEKEGLQKVLDALDNEQIPLMRPDGSSAAPMQLDDDNEADSNAASQRAFKVRLAAREAIIKELESQLQAYQREAGLKPAMHASATSTAEPIPSVVALLSQVTHLEKSHTHLESMTTALSEKVDWINAHYPQLLDMEFGQYKIVTLPNNPSHVKLDNKYKKEIEGLKAENAVLKLKCEELQQQITSGGVASVFGSAASSSPSASSLLALETKYQSQLSTLENEKSQLEKKTQRLKEIFSQKVTEFRNTCYQLTGYKIELSAGSYKLKHMYAEKETDHLMFQQQGGTNGPLSVLETEFTKNLDANVTTYLEKFESIPGFLAACTLQLLEKQTRR